MLRELCNVIKRLARGNPTERIRIIIARNRVDPTETFHFEYIIAKLHFMDIVIALWEK